MTLSPGTRLGPYEIIAPLGAGAMGEVYRARDPRLERDVALKILPDMFARDAERMALFRREALALAAINHPNIATVFGFEESAPGQHVLVLELVEGESLSSRLRHGSLSSTDALRIVAQIAEALEAAHARGVIHRDLKPGNVMLGPRGLVKVLDFGLAQSRAARSAVSAPTEAATQPSWSPERELASATASTHAPNPTGSNDASGTPGYMSPEQVRAEAQDERTDVFALGCVLYECLTTRRAFQGKDARAAIEAILHGAPDWKRLPAELPMRVRELVVSCLEKDPERRPAAMRDVRLVLEDALGIRRASALRAGEAAPAAGNLPRQPTRFVGREGALRDCAALLESTRLLTMTGVGGCGKTRLALRLAESVTAEFPDGVWFVDLAALSDPGRLPQAAASALGVREEPGVPLTESLSRHLAEWRALLLLDNCEHLLSACATLAETLLDAAPNLRVLATSREGLGIRGEQAYAVPSLALPATERAPDARAAGEFEAVRLFVDRATLVRPDFVLTDENAALVADVCRRLDGIPLAIELAAARVRMLSVEQIHAKLHDRFRLLAGGSRAALPRHQTLRAAIQWSYDHLTEDERDLFRALSVFAGGWTLEAAAGAIDPARDEFEVLDLLTHLADKSLVVVERLDSGEPRYRFLETVRQYGRDLLIEAGRADVARRRHRDWFLALAERAAEGFAGPEQAAWLDRLETEIENLRAALDWSIEEDPDPEMGLRLAGAVQWLWAIRGHFTEGRRWFDAVLARERGAEPTPALARALQGAGNLAFRQDDYETARAHYERRREACERLGDRTGLAGALGALGNVAQYQGRYGEARELFEQSLALNRERGYMPWVAANLTCLGNVSRCLDDLGASRSFLEQAVVANREIGNPVGEASSLDGLGCLLLQLGDVAAAKQTFEQSIAIARGIGSVFDEAATLSNLGLVAQEMGRPEEAYALFARALSQMRTIGGRKQISVDLERLGTLAAHEQDWERAVTLWSAGDEVKRTLGAPMDPIDARDRERLRGSAHSALGEAGFEAARARGVETPLERTIEFALDRAAVGADGAGAPR